MGLNETDVFLVLKPKEEWRVPDKEWLIRRAAQGDGRSSGSEIAFTQPIEMRTSEMLTGARGDLAVKIFGPDLKVLAELAGKIKAALQEHAGRRRGDDGIECDGRLSRSQGRPHDGRPHASSPSRASRTNCAPARRNAGGARYRSRAGGQISSSGRPATPGDSPEQFGLTQLAAGDGGLVRVSDVAQLKRTGGPVKVDRENSSRFALVQAYVSGRDLVGYVEDAQKAVAEAVAAAAGLPAGLGRRV